MGESWYLRRSGEQEVEPLDRSMLLERINRGDVSAFDEVRRTDTSTWLAATIENMSDDCSVPSPPPVPETSDASGDLSQARVDRNGQDEWEEHAHRFISWLFGIARMLREELGEIRAWSWETARARVELFCCFLDRLTQQDVLVDAQLKLGQQLWAADLGDSKLRSQLHECHDRIESLRAANADTKPQLAEQKGLFIRLASTLPDENEPEAVVEARRVVNEAEASIAKTNSSSEECRLWLHQRSGEQKLRSAAGCMAMMIAVAAPIVFMVVVAFSWLFDFSGPSTVQSANDDEHLEKAVGFVVQGWIIKSRDGETVELPGNRGTCFVVTDDGYLITNRHVLAIPAESQKLEKNIQANGNQVTRQVWVYFGREQKYVAKIVYESARHDLAILKIDGADELAKLRLASYANVARGTEVYACGFPDAANGALSDSELREELRRKKTLSKIETYFKARDFDFVSTRGSVSRIAKEEQGRVWIQHDASIHFGNSGGPLIDDAGVVLGINTKGNIAAPGINFAVSMPQLRKELEAHIPGLEWE